MAAQRKVVHTSDAGYALSKVGFSWPSILSSLHSGASGHGHVVAVLHLSLADVLLWVLSGVSEAKGRELLALVALVVSLAYAIVRGRSGNEWLGASLLRKGYREHGEA